jgi:2-polyprenyl-3-methyl-5-hydroxy-6-metoxy-1,4-benzoquinol methylase
MAEQSKSTVVNMDQSAKFWDRIADKYSKQPVADEASYQHKLQVTREYFRPDMEVLEFGCGTGSTALVHAPYVKRILAIDISSKMIEIAQGKADSANVDNVTFRQANIAELGESSETYDAVLGLSILHLLADKEAVIDKVNRMLKPGGVFITSTVCLADQMRFLPLRVILPIGRLFGRLPMVKFLTAKAVLASLTDVGFDIDYQWQPGKGKALFVVAKKPMREGTQSASAD